MNSGYGKFIQAYDDYMQYAEGAYKSGKVKGARSKYYALKDATINYVPCNNPGVDEAHDVYARAVVENNKAFLKLIAKTIKIKLDTQNRLLNDCRMAKSP